MACQGFGNISKEEKEEYLQKKMEDMKKKSEEILRRHAEVEADKRNADMLSDMVSTKFQGNLHSQSINIVKNVKSSSHVQKEKSSELPIAEKKFPTIHSVEKQRNSRHIPEESVHPAERMRNSGQMLEESIHSSDRIRSSRQKCDENFLPRRKEIEHRKKLSEDDGPPPDPINYLSDPYRDGSFPDVDRNQDSRRHRSNYGGENFRNVKPVMQQRRNYERQHPPPPPSSHSHLSMSVQMTGKERKEYENWKAERLKIDEERIARQKTSMGTWKREWDLNKTEQEEAAKKGDKQFYKQPRWISESGDHHEQNDKKNQANRGRFNPSFDYNLHEKGDRSVMVNEHNTLTVVKSSEYDDEQVLESQYQRNQGGRKIFERKQNTPISEERNCYNKKDTSWKQNDQKVSTTSKCDGWEDIDVTSDKVKWDNDLFTKKDIGPLQQANNTDKEWRTGIKFNQRKNDPIHEVRGSGNNRYYKNNSNSDFRDKFYAKRQKSLNAEVLHEGNTRQQKQSSSDKIQHPSNGYQGGRFSNNGRKYEDESKDDTGWGKLRNKGQKVSDGWENEGEVNKTKDTKNKLVSDGWEKEENWGKIKENLQRRSSDGFDKDESFNSTSYEHKQKHFSGERSRGGSFRGNNSKIYHSTERGKQHMDNRKHENPNQRSFSSVENWQFRGKEDKIPSETEQQNIDRRWEGFDHKRGAGRNQFWEGNRKGNDQRKAFRGQSNRGNVRNSFGMNRNTVQSQEYHNKNPNFTNSGANEICKHVESTKTKTEISKDGWDCDPDSKFQSLPIKWIDNEEKIPYKDPCKVEHHVSVNTIENVSSQESSGPEQQQKISVQADTESHDDSWEDVTSGCESELSDPNDEILQRSMDTLCIESKFQDGLCDDKLGKNDGFEHNLIQDICEISCKNFSNTKNTVDNPIEHQCLESIEYCKEISDNSFSIITSNVQFISSHNDSIERILEEVYNDTIKAESSKCIKENTETMEHNNTGTSDLCDTGLNSTKELSRLSENSTEDGRCDESSIVSLENTISEVIDEPLQYSSDICYEDSNKDDKEDSAVVDGDENEYIYETNNIILSNYLCNENSIDNSCNPTSQYLSTFNVQYEETNSDSYSNESAVDSSLSNTCSNSKGCHSQNNSLHLTSSIPACDICADADNAYKENDILSGNFDRELKSSLPANTKNVTNEISDACVTSAPKSAEEFDSSHQKLNQVIQESTKCLSDLSKLDLSATEKQIQELGTTHIIKQNCDEPSEIPQNGNMTKNSCDNIVDITEVSATSIEKGKKVARTSAASSENMLINEDICLESANKLKQNLDCTKDFGKELSDVSTVSITKAVEVNSNTSNDLNNLVKENTEIFNESSKFNMCVKVEHLHKPSVSQIVKNDNDEQVMEATQNKNITCENTAIVEVIEHNTEISSLLPECALSSDITSSLEVTDKSTKIKDVKCNANYNDVELTNASIVVLPKTVNTSSQCPQVLEEELNKGSTEYSRKENTINLKTEMQQIHESVIAEMKKSTIDQQPPEVAQNKINFCEDLNAFKIKENTKIISSANTLVNLNTSSEPINKLKETKNTDCDSENVTGEHSSSTNISTVESIQVNNSCNAPIEVSSEESKIESCKEVQHMLESTLAQTNKDTTERQLLETVSDTNSANNIGVYNNSDISCKRVRNNKQEAEIPSEYALNCDSTLSECTDKLEETKDFKCDNVKISDQIISDSNIVAYKHVSQILPVTEKNTLNLQSDIQMEIVIDDEQSKDISSAFIMNFDKAKEQILEDTSLDLDNDSQNVLQNPVSDYLKEPLARSVRKASATESTTEFTEVLEVTTSIPQRVVLQDKESAHFVYKDEYSLDLKECEQISKSHNLDTRLSKNELGE